MILLFCCELHSCDERNITLKFDCSQDGVYFKCKTENLEILKSDKNANFLMEEEKSPQEIVIELSTMSFIPSEIFRKFKEVKEFIAKNVSLEDIYIDTFKNAQTLRYLILSQNKIQRLIDMSFSNVSSLQSLKLQNNQINSLGSRAFYGLKELRTLILSFNKIANLPLYIFRDLKSLEDLQVDNNLITVISCYQFERNLDLTSLHLENNEIATIDNGTFENLTKLERVFLNGNNCVDKSFAPWRADNQSELNCCMKPFEEMKECANTKVGETNSEGNFPSHIPLIILLSLSTFANFLVVTYFLVYRKKDREVSPENFELIISDQNGNPYRVFSD